MVQHDGNPAGANRRGTGEPLTDVTIRAWIKSNTVGKLWDGLGLYLHRRTPDPAPRTPLSERRTPVWRCRYRLNGKEQVATFGPYGTDKHAGELTLKGAREKRDELRVALRRGNDPSTKRREAKATFERELVGPTFRVIAGEWLASKRWSESHAAKVERSLEVDVYPALGDRSIATITRADVAAVLATVVDRGARETGSRIQQRIARVFDFAIAKGILETNPATHTRGVLGDAPAVERRPALLELDPLRDILKRCDVLQLSRQVWLANRLIAFTASRVGPAISATWDEFDLNDECPTWRVPRARMKVKDGNKGDFVAYLGPILAAELRAWKAATAGTGFLFTSPFAIATKHPHIEHAALNRLYTRTLKLGGTHCPHGWRSSLRSLGAKAGFAREPLELMLDHQIGEDVERAYHRYDYATERHAIALWWEQTLLSPDIDSKVLPLAKRA